MPDLSNSQRKILLIGSNGQIGSDLAPLLPILGKTFQFDQADCDLSHPDQIVKMVNSIRPNLIINAAAYTAVDKAEEETHLAMAINGTAPGILAEQAKKINAALIHYSTDYVFDGNKAAPYNENDSINPINMYGKSKAKGDQNILDSGVPFIILRTTWVYNRSGKNFLTTMTRLAKEKKEIKVVNDQIGTPTWSQSIANATVQVLKQALGNNSPENNTEINKYSGIYNLSCSGKSNWYEFAKIIINNLNLDSPPLVTPIPTSEFPTPAQRPKNSILSNEKIRKTFGISLPVWADAFLSCVHSERP